MRRQNMPVNIMIYDFGLVVCLGIFGHCGWGVIIVVAGIKEDDIIIFNLLMAC
jgi:hypothetical protein